ncbi:hypothetical protein Ptr902_11620 [Pyrenophora tritici-repentis]|nr:hypothetical protein Ptr902_11620 [Pyrenophora tritici-repentis]
MQLGILAILLSIGASEAQRGRCAGPRSHIKVEGSCVRETTNGVCRFDQPLYTCGYGSELVYDGTGTNGGDLCTHGTTVYPCVASWYCCPRG